MANELFHFNGVQAILTDIGIKCEEANTIASASQAIDDFHEDKLITFENGELFYPVITAHKMIDRDNLDSRDASAIWMPFHFFPNKNGVCEPDTENVDKLIGFIKHYEFKSDIERQLLHGILLHIYVDTYTHEGFMGLHCKHNNISSLDDEDALDISWIIGNIPPSIGHGEALTYPDDMWRKWSYKDNKDLIINRDNQAIFLNIVKGIQRLMSELGYDVTEMTSSQLQCYENIFSIKGGGQKYDNKIRNLFDKITIGNVGGGDNISYQIWKKDIIRKMQSNENRYARYNSLEISFDESKWVVFQRLAKEVRTFFKKEIFPGIRIKTEVY